MQPQLDHPPAQRCCATLNGLERMRAAQSQNGIQQKRLISGADSACCGTGQPAAYTHACMHRFGLGMRREQRAGLTNAGLYSLLIDTGMHGKQRGAWQAAFRSSVSYLWPHPNRCGLPVGQRLGGPCSNIDGSPALPGPIPQSTMLLDPSWRAN